MTKPRLFINGYGVADVAYDPADSVSVTADGVKTYSALLDELYALVDFSKVSVNSKIRVIRNNAKMVYNAGFSSNATYNFIFLLSSNYGITVYRLIFQASSSQAIYFDNSAHDESSAVLANGEEIRLYY